LANKRNLLFIFQNHYAFDVAIITAQCVGVKDLPGSERRYPPFTLPFNDIWKRQAPKCAGFAATAPLRSLHS